MKNLIATTALLLASQFACAADLLIEVTDVKSAEGKVMVALFDAQGFLKRPVKAASAPAVQGTNKVVLTDVPEGEYAFAVYHDANDNGKMDKNMIGIPTEDYGFSNNALGKMGPPSFDSARFALTAAGATARVSLK